MWALEAGLLALLSEDSQEREGGLNHCGVGYCGGLTDFSMTLGAGRRENCVRGIKALAVSQRRGEAGLG